MTEREKTAALLVYLFACLAYPGPRHDERVDEPGFYEWITDCAFRKDDFGSACCWAMRMSATEPEETAEQWLSYVEHVLGNYRRRGVR